MGIGSPPHTRRSSLRGAVKFGGQKTWCEQNRAMFICYEIFQVLILLWLYYHLKAWQMSYVLWKMTSHVKLLWERNCKNGEYYHVSVWFWVLNLFGSYSKSMALPTLRLQAVVWNWFFEFILLSSVNAKILLINDSVSQLITPVLNHWQSMSSGFLHSDIMNNWWQSKTGKKRSLQS